MRRSRLASWKAVECRRRRLEYKRLLKLVLKTDDGVAIWMIYCSRCIWNKTVNAMNPSAQHMRLSGDVAEKGVQWCQPASWLCDDLPAIPYRIPCSRLSLLPAAALELFKNTRYLLLSVMNM